MLYSDINKNIMTIQEIKKQVAELMALTAQHWKEVYGKEEEATQEEKVEYDNFQEYRSEEHTF